VGPTASFSYPNMGQDSSKQGIGNDVLEQSEESKLQCVIKTSADPSDLNGVSRYIPSSITHTPHSCLWQVLKAIS